MRHLLLTCCVLFFYPVEAFNCDSLSLIIKEKQFLSFPLYYEKTISDNYTRRNKAGILKKIYSTIQEGDTIFILELQDRQDYISNYTSIWTKSKSDSIYSYTIYNDIIYYQNGSEYPKSMIDACMDWNVDILRKAGEEHIRRWTDRAEVIITRIAFAAKDLLNIECFVFYDFYENDLR
jgi:hypothetical protein